VTFVPVDPQASDLAAALASELARGVSYHSRSRYEVSWTSVTTVAECRARLQESGRIRSASLDMWPDRPHLANTHPLSQSADGQGSIACFLLGLRHDAAHLDQLGDVIAQARAYRKQQTFLGKWRTARNARRKSQNPTAA
jgi:hypothetical protein